MKIQGETASIDETAALNFVRYWQKSLMMMDIAQIKYLLPNRRFIAKSEKTASSFKTTKDRITLLLCGNASGTKMLKLLITNKVLHPRALKGINLAEYPVDVMSNKKAQVTSVATYFNDCFISEVERYIPVKGLPFKVLLIVDNAPDYPFLEHPNVQIMFLPSNTTSHIQHLDEGIIANFKKYYVKSSFSYILKNLENDKLSRMCITKM